MMLREINKFCTKHKMADSRFGREAIKDPRLVGDLRRGRSLSAKTAAKVSAYIESGPIDGV
jgi:hypothetical protein